jgi:asparagine synthase (glutamine-hydrolysing)
MCGIAGACWNRAEQGIDEPTLKAMMSVLAHRGPDDAGTWLEEADGTRRHGVALGHQRLAIIDLSAAGRQPMSNSDKTIWITFNGEIYNYRELRAGLESSGHVFRTDTDTEVIVHLYQRYGVDCVDHLRGMFAFAVWDRNEERLVLFRDRLGQKPLFYRAESNRLIFASELKALLQIPNAPRDVDFTALNQFLTYQYVPHPHCILQGYQKLPPGHRAIYSNGTLQVERYWQAPYSDPVSNRAAAEWRQQLRETMTEAVRLRMRSDVPLGAFLSGGVDSTIIVGLMQSLTEQPVRTFSIGFPVARFDEREFAREAAQFLGTSHHEKVVAPSALDVLPDLVWHYDEPFADSSAIPTMALSRMTRQHVTVALSGDAGDELFAGYDRYKAVKLAAKIDRLPGFVQRFLGADLWQKIPSSIQQKSKLRRLKRLLAAVNQSPERRYLQWVSIFDEARRTDVLSDELRSTLAEDDPADFLLSTYRICPNRDFVTQTTCADVHSYLPCDLLTKVDIASMSVGLECRGPFLDHEVVELAAKMPIELKLNRHGGKRILIETFADLLPPSIQTRKKMGFGVPIDHWFRTDLKPLLHDILLDETARSRGVFDPDNVRTLVEEHTSGQFDHAYRLWSLLCCELWFRTYIDSATAAGPISL